MYNWSFSLLQVWKCTAVCGLYSHHMASHRITSATNATYCSLQLYLPFCDLIILPSLINSNVFDSFIKCLVNVNHKIWSADITQLSPLLPPAVLEGFFPLTSGCSISRQPIRSENTAFPQPIAACCVFKGFEQRDVWN